MAEEQIHDPAKYPGYIKRLFQKTGVKAWEPIDPNHPLVVWGIKEGYLRRVDGRCGFELLKDQMCEWTDAGKAALRVDDVTRPE